MKFFDRKIIYVSKMFPFGAHIRAIKDLKSKQALEGKTIGDPRSVEGDYILEEKHKI